jgi:hypothetical protein
MRSMRVILALAALLATTGAFSSSWAEEKAASKQPSTIIHHVTFKWKATATDADKQKVLDGLKAIVNELPGAKNLWLKTTKVQPRDFSQTFVIEFENEAALKAYAEHPKKKEWNDFYYSVREVSQNCVTTN